MKDPIYMTHECPECGDVHLTEARGTIRNMEQASYSRVESDEVSIRTAKRRLLKYLSSIPGVGTKAKDVHVAVGISRRGLEVRWSRDMPLDYLPKRYEGYAVHYKVIGEVRPK